MDGKDRNGNLLILFLLLFFSLHRFYNLGFKEIQMWDEALYGVRAKSIYYFNDWIDQTKHAVGGLYSSSHPPLLIWLIALTYKIFGVSEFTTRFFSALFGSLTVILIHILTKKFFDNKAAIFSIPFIGSIYIFNFYSRQAQLDIPYIFFITLSIYFYFEFLNGKKSFIYLTAFSFGLALMTKIMVGFFIFITICLFLTLMLLRKEISIKEAIKQVVIIFSIGVLIALPWHIYMFKIHGLSFINSFFKFHIIERLSKGVEGNIPELGYFYILNQLIVQFPPAVLIFFDLFEILKNLEQFDKKRILVQAWFWSIFLITSISKTKIPTYTLPSLIPAVIISSVYLGKLLTKNINSIHLSALLISTVWSSSQSLRNGVKDFLKLNFNESSIISTLEFLTAILLSPLIAKLMLKLKREILANFLLYLTLLTGFFIVLKTEILIDYTKYDDGARVICKFIDSSEINRLFYLYTEHSTEGMNPQLTFYSYKKLSNSIEWVEIPRKDFQNIEHILTNYSGAIILMERSRRDKFEKSAEFDSVIKLLEKFHYKQAIKTKRYLLFTQQI